MTWEEKVEMIELANNVYNKESRQKFLKYVTEHIQKFDSQAYDMFITSMSFVPEEMKEDVEYHKIIFPYINNFINNKIKIIGTIVGSNQTASVNDQKELQWEYRFPSIPMVLLQIERSAQE